MKNKSLENFEIKTIQGRGDAPCEPLDEDKAYVSKVTSEDYLNPIKNPHVEEVLVFLLKEISDKQRAIIKMIFMDGEKQIKVAKKLGLSESAISRLKERAFRQLGKRLVYSSCGVNLFEKVCRGWPIKDVNHVKDVKSARSKL